MNEKFEKIFDQIEIERKTLLRKVSLLNEGEFNSKPADGKWSVAEILTHLLTSERLSLLYMRKKYKGVDQVGNSGLVEYLKMTFLKFSQRVAFFKYKAPKVIRENTPDTMTYSNLVAAWDKSRLDLKKFLESIPAENVRKKIYKHPIVGRLDAAQGVEFLSEHFRHHLPQINRLIH